MKKIMSFILSFINCLMGVVPILSLLSIFIVTITFFLGTFVSGYINQISFVKIIFLIINIFYLIRLIKLRRNKMLIAELFSSMLAIVAFFVDVKFILLLFYVPISIIILFTEEKFDRLREQINKNKATMAFFNFFDFVYIVVMYNLYHSIVCKKIFSDVKIPDNLLFPLTILIFIIIVFLIPLHRGLLSIFVYRKSNGISLGHGKVLWNTYIKNYFSSIVASFLYFGLIISQGSKELTIIQIISIYVIPSLLNIFFWSQFTEQIDNGGVDRSDVLAQWQGFFIIGISLVIFDQIEADFIGILSWLLPVLLPIFIGEINLLGPAELSNKEASLKMRKHLYYLQIICFNTLVVLNVIISKFTVKIVDKNNYVIEVNRAKEFIGSVLQMIPNFDNLPNFLLSILVSTILVLISFLIAMLISKMMIGIFKRIYLKNSEEYFN